MFRFVFVLVKQRPVFCTCRHGEGSTATNVLTPSLIAYSTEFINTVCDVMSYFVVYSELTDNSHPASEYVSSEKSKKESGVASGKVICRLVDYVNVI